MISKYDGGIKNLYPQRKPIPITELVKIIKCNPQKDIIIEIRELRKNGDEKYKILKKKLTYVTPNCVLKKRDLKDPNNFQYSSGYVFLDYDGMPNVAAFKTDFINQYNHLISLVCTSSSSGGLSVLVKVDADLDMNNFKSAWTYLAHDIFTQVSAYIDASTKNIGRAMYVSYDSEVFYNYENEVAIPPSVLRDDKQNITRGKGAKQCITKGKQNNTLKCTSQFELLDYYEVHDNVILQTPVYVTNPVVDFNPIEFVSVRFPSKIADGTKHKIYTLLIHYLVHLNPNLSPSHIYTFIYFINNKKGEPPMQLHEFQQLFKLEYSKTQQVDYVFKNKTIKNFHLNKDAKLDRIDKITIMNGMNGKKRTKDVIDKILAAKEKLESNNIKITQKKISEESGVSLRTVKKYYRVEEPLDIISITGDINMKYQCYTTTTTTINWIVSCTIDELF